jgi:SAM-dependent methyltransferase
VTERPDRPSNERTTPPLHAPAQTGAGGEVAIDLGCGIRKQPGALGLDIARITGSVDLLGDVTRTPFRDACADRVYASHIVEHLDDLPAFMAEIWRICKHDAVVHFRFPHASSSHTAWTDPTHQRALTMETFDYFRHAPVVFGYYPPPRSGSSAAASPSASTPTSRTGLALAAEPQPRPPRHRPHPRCSRQPQQADPVRLRAILSPLVGMEEPVWLRAIKQSPTPSEARP